MTSANRDLLAEYVQTYIEWRHDYGLANDCMDELLAALRVESERETVDPQVRSALVGLARLIEVERSCALEQAA